MATASLLRLALSPGSNLNPNSRNYVGVAGSTRRYDLPPLRLYRRRAPPTRLLRLPRAKAVEIGAPAGDSQRGARESSSVLLEVGGMMCGACASRVRSILAADERVESAVVNMLMETAAVRLRTGAAAEEEAVAEELAARLTECGFPSRRRTRSGSGVGENVRKLKEMAQRKGELLARSRNRVAFAWTLVALCCGSHASHLLHSLGIHVAHGSLWEILHNSYVKCGIAMVSLFGPGRDILFDGLRAFKQGSPNMNSLVGFGSIAAFLLSAVSLLNPGLEWEASFFDEPDGPLRIKATTTGALSTIAKIVRMVEDAQACEAPIQRLADSIAGPFVYSVMTLSAATFFFWYYIGSHIFPEVLLNDIAGPDGSSLILSLKLAVDVLVVSCPCALGLATPTAILVGTSLGAKQGLLIRGGDVLERLAGINIVALDKTGTLTEGRPVVTAVASLAYKESEILRLAAAVERTVSHPIARAIMNKAELLNLEIPSTRGQLTEPGFGCLAEVDGSLVAAGTKDWVHERFQQKASLNELMDLELRVAMDSSNMESSSNHSKSIVYVGREGEGIIGAIAISDVLRDDAKSTVERLQAKGIKTILLSGDRKEAVASVGKMVGIGSENLNSSLAPQQKSSVISSLQAEGHSIAMVGDGINDAPSLALADVGVALQTEAKDNAASDAASVILLGNRLSQLVDVLSLAQATMAKVHQNLAWAVAYNVVAIPVAAGVLLPQFDFAMTPSLSGGLMALSSIFVVSNSLLLQLHGSFQKKENHQFYARDSDR
ncbi:Copper-transporting ATPase PAA2, chloroplastic [Ananas comosus]|uniref:Copper-transporting ATPase PAA2, chloroplastic n=1 Tax=Ananas comosus TaxID=4615 RepID=A0A199VUY5_ANACO|nr:Copper-transporting ATPase PAA2, chloroplastic [Ananas comosus]